MGTLKQFSRIQSDDPSLNRLQDQLASALNPILRNVQGDLSGPLESPTVTKLQGRNLAPTAPQTGQALVWNGTQWAPGAGSGGTVTLAGDATGPSSANTVERIQGQDVSSAAPSTGDVLTWDGTQWEAAAPTAGTLAGDVTGPSGSNTVERIQGYDVSNAAPSTNDALVWSGTAWTPTPIPASIYPQRPAAWGSEYLWWRCDDAPQPGAAANFVVNYGSAGTATLTSPNTFNTGSNGGFFFSKIPMLGAPGPFQTVARFGTTLDPLRGANALWPAGSSLTTSAWFRAPSYSVNTRILEKIYSPSSPGPSSSVSMTFFNNRIYYRIRTGGVTYEFYTQSGVPPVGEPIMVSMTFDGTTARGYVNGQLVTQFAIASSVIDWASGAADYWQISDSLGSVIGVDIWDVRVAPVVRTEAQLLADYKTGSGYSY